MPYIYYLITLVFTPEVSQDPVCSIRPVPFQETGTTGFICLTRGLLVPILLLTTVHHNYDMITSFDASAPTQLPDRLTKDVLDMIDFTHGPITHHHYNLLLSFLFTLHFPQSRLACTAPTPRGVFRP